MGSHTYRDDDRSPATHRSAIITYRPPPPPPPPPHSALRPAPDSGRTKVTCASKKVAAAAAPSIPGGPLLPRTGLPSANHSAPIIADATCTSCGLARHPEHPELRM